MNAALQITPQSSIRDLARRHSIEPLQKMGEVLFQHTEALMHTLQQQDEHNRKLSARIARQEAQLQEFRDRDTAFRADMTELLEQCIELNLSNYGPEDVEQQQAWTLQAYDQIQAAANSIPAPHECDDLGTGSTDDLACSVCGKYMPHPF